MKGKLYGVGVGCGDPELLTIKAVKVIDRCSIIAVPQKSDGKILALEIVGKSVCYMENKKVLKIKMPMIRDKDDLQLAHKKGAEIIKKELDKGNDVAFLTLGDPTIYSTYIYIHKIILDMGYECEIVSGVPSFCTVAGKLNISLCEGEQKLIIIPSSNLKEIEKNDSNSTKIYMKSGKNTSNIVKQITEKGLKQEAYIAQNCCLDGEKLSKVCDITQDMDKYFSIIISKNKEDR